MPLPVSSRCYGAAPPRVHVPKRLRSPTQNASDLLIVLEADGTIRSVGPAVERVLGIRPEELVGARISGFVRPGDRAGAIGAFREAPSRPGVHPPGELRHPHENGPRRHHEQEAADDHLGEPGVGDGLISHLDDAERRRAQEALKESGELRSRLVAIVESSNDAIVGTTLDGTITSWNSGAQSIFSYPAEEAIGEPLSMLVPPDRAEEVSRMLEKVRRGEKVDHHETVRVAKDGRRVPISITASPLRGSQGGVVGVSTIARDISESQALKEWLVRLAFHDPLTGLPNRALFTDRLERALARLNRRDEPVAILFLDLDDLKRVNDSLGHEAGDHLLVEVAERLKGCLRPEDTVARLGGDEFTVLLEGIDDADAAKRAAERVLEALRRPFVLEGHKTSVGASLGVAVATNPRQNPQCLLKDADRALYEAKRRGKARYEVFDAGMGADPA